MAPRVSIVVLGLAIVAGVATAGCQQTPLPGKMLGTYKATGTAKTNSCGRGLRAPNPWVFEADISEEGSTAYWSWLDGSAPLSGPVSPPATVSFRTSRTANVDSGDAGAAPCALERTDDVEITLGAGSPPGSFNGTITYSFAVASGSTCDDQLASGGGTYDALPCTVSYEVAASRR